MKFYLPSQRRYVEVEVINQTGYMDEARSRAQQTPQQAQEREDQGYARVLQLGLETRPVMPTGSRFD